MRMAIRRSNGFISRFQSARLRKCLSQWELGQLADVRTTNIARWELGKLEPEYDELQRCADVLEVSLEYLRDGIRAPRDRNPRHTHRRAVVGKAHAARTAARAENLHALAGDPPRDATG